MAFGSVQVIIFFPLNFSVTKWALIST